jgi:hypothetical protein
MTADPIPGQVHHDAEWQRGHDALDRAHAARDIPIGERVRDLARQRDQARRIACSLEAETARLRALHYRIRDSCAHCQHAWPCPTVQMLEGVTP